MDIGLRLDKTEKSKLAIIFNWFKRFAFKNKNSSSKCNIGCRIQFGHGLTLILNTKFYIALFLRIEHWIVKFFEIFSFV